MKQIILGTAGHIDHGKTSLVKALTGIDTDRLKEEKERGITIELGFAYLKLSNDKLVGIVDVPGHERFVKNMVAGATGIDMVALIIAAEEGVMPQTKEHLEICQLLGVRHGIVVITKIDLVEREWLELVKDEIRESLKGTFLESAPMVEVSSVTGQGLTELLQRLEEVTEAIPQREEGVIFRLPVDRVFTIKGFGTVITGTTISGTISVGEEVTIYPQGLVSKVRGIQVHGQGVTQAFPGARTALNLQGLEKSAIKRGNVVAKRDSLKPTQILDCYLELLPSSPYKLKNRAEVRFHVGTSEIMAKVILLDRPNLSPGDSCFVRFKLAEPVAVLRGDRYVIRSYSPIKTIGGGNILNPCPPENKKLKHINLDELRILNGNNLKDIVEVVTKNADFKGLTINELIFFANAHEDDLSIILKELIAENKILNISENTGLYIHMEYFKKAEENLNSLLSNFHLQYPLKLGMHKQELRSRSVISENNILFDYIVEHMKTQGYIVIEKDTVRLSSHIITLDENQKKIKEKILSKYFRMGLQVPTLRELREEINDPRLDEVLDLLVAEGTLVKVKEELLFHTEHIKKAEEQLKEFLLKNGEINPAQFKDLTNLSRKYAIPLLEYFDKRQVTVRVGDKRVLRK